jgi:16S rRNA (cytosine967-C5)-methyltransferase
MKIIKLRTTAAQIVAQLLSATSNLTELLDEVPVTYSDRAYLQEICFGTVRFLPRLERILSLLLQQPVSRLPIFIHALLLVGLFELDYTHTAPYAVINEIVGCTKTKRTMQLSGMVNAVLRNYLRRRENIRSQLQDDREAVTAHPLWLIHAIEQAWSNSAQDIYLANNTKAPMALRINQRKIMPEEYIDQVLSQGITIRPSPWHKNGAVLETPLPVTALPGFIYGLCSVQDLAAQWAAELLDLKPGLRVLDVCAAPGGKTAHILELEPNLAECVAMDKNPKRVARIKENLARLQLQATIICADAQLAQISGVTGEFDRILLDAPCSATGVIRRHPDIKMLRQPGDIAKFAQQQLQLLVVNWTRLKKGGELLYATCSILPEENDHVIAAFLAQTADASVIPFFFHIGIKTTHGWQILPGQDDMDGFYYAGLRKI